MRNKMLKGAALLLLAAGVASCSHDIVAVQDNTEQEYSDNFKENILGGQEIDPNQDWKTVVNTPVTVSVDLDYDATYTVYIYSSAPLFTDAAYIGMATLKSGEQTTINVARPVNAVMLYAACYDKNSNAIAKMFVVTEEGGTVAFGEQQPAESRAVTRSVSSGNRWSVAPLNMPDVTAYTTGTLYEMQAAFNGNSHADVKQSDPSVKHLKISGSYSGVIERIQSYANQSVYVTGTWTVPTEQRCTGGSVIVVGNGGEIVIPSGRKLSTNSGGNGTTGMVYVLPGGKISGQGTMEFSNGTQTYSYNAGTITVKNINLNGGTLYNAGSLGTDGVTNASSLPYLTGPGGTDAVPSKLVNLGHCTLDRVDGAGIAIENACNINVINTLHLGKSSKMDNGSYVECGQLELSGSNNGGVVLYMGNGACMNCKGNFAVLNFGVWGPTSNNGNSISNAIFRIGGCANYSSSGMVGCNYLEGNPSTFLLDHVDLVLPNNYPSGVDYPYAGNSDLTDYNIGYLDGNGSNYCAKLLLYGWYNGLSCRLIDGNNYQMVNGEYVAVNQYWGYYKQVPVWKSGTSYTSFGDDRRVSCLLRVSNSLSFRPNTEDNCGINIDLGPVPQPEPNYIYYAFEDLGSTKDFDFNDVVLRVATPQQQSNRTFNATVQILAAGGELEAYVLYNGQPFGAEVHKALGGSVRTITNTRSVDPKLFSTLGTITGLASADVDLTNLPFTLKVIRGGKETVIGGSGTRVTGSAEGRGVAPLYVVVSGDEETGKWFWPYELVDVSVAYPRFGSWGADASTNLNWYRYPASGTQKVVKY